MAAPQTGYEAHGGWTSMSEQADFLDQIATDTGAVRSTVGLSEDGQPLDRLDVGTDVKGTMLVVTLQHGNECAPREGVLAFARDLAYSTDPDIVAYLAEHRVVFLPAMNPWGFPTNRLNSNGHDINRDHLQLYQSETRAITQTVRDTGTAMILDCHGRDDITTDADMEMAPDVLNVGHPALRALSDDLYATVLADVNAGGYHARRYNFGPGWNLRSIATYLHAITLLTETWGPGGTPRRVETMRYALEQARQWHQTNATELTAARHASLTQAEGNHGPIEIGGTVYDPPPDGYRMTTATAVPTRLAEGHGITADAQGFIPTNQAARPLIPHLFDPDSPDVATPAERIGSWPVDPAPQPPPGWRIQKFGQVVRPLRVEWRKGGQAVPIPTQ